MPIHFEIIFEDESADEHSVWRLRAFIEFWVNHFEWVRLCSTKFYLAGESCNIAQGISQSNLHILKCWARQHVDCSNVFSSYESKSSSTR